MITNNKKMKTENFKLLLSIYFLILFLVSIKNINCFKCGANKFKLNAYHLNSNGNDERRRLAVEYTPIKIGVDYSSFIKPTSMFDLTFINIKEILEDTFNEFQKFISVQHTDIDLSDKEEIIKRSCDLSTVAYNYSRFLIQNDVIIFPIFSSDLGNDTLAAATYCLTDGKRPRPVGGVLKLNSNMNFSLLNTNLYMKRLFFHEITHILVFNPTLLNRLGLTSTRNSITYVKSTKVLSKAKQHFNCGTLTGIPLEDQGGNGTAGYHWEARYMLGDYMISADYLDNVISDITIALFEDTKYYKVNYYSGGLFKYGKNKGCNFLTKKCVTNGTSISNDDFCTSAGQSMCSTSKTNKGICMIFDYSSSGISVPTKFQYFNNPNQGGFLPASFCPVVESPYSEYDYLPTSCRVGTSNFSSEYGEIIGENSFCFLSSLLPSASSYNIALRPTCYRAECNKNTKQTIVFVGNSTFICPTEGGIISGTGFKGYLTCPNYTDICGTETNTLCNEMFDCLNAKIETDPDIYLYDDNDNTFNKFISGKNIKLNFYSIAMILMIYLFS